MKTEFAEIVAMYSERKSNTSLEKNTALRVRDQYNGDIVVGVLDSADVPLAVNIVQQGVDKIAQRWTSTQPNLYFPPIKPGVETYEKLAKKQRQAMYGIWDKNKLRRKRKRRARHVIAYGTGPTTVRPDFKGTYPRWDLRDPLTTYPCPSNDPDELVPYDCIFAYKRSLKWIKYHYPLIVLNRPDLFPKRADGSLDPDRQYTILEYIDDYEIVLGVIGNDEVMYRDVIVGSGVGELDRIPNRAGVPLTVIPKRITLDRNLGQYDGMLGMFVRQAEMMALTHEALKRGIVPALWVVGRQGEIPTIHATPDPDTGEVGQISGGELTQVKIDPAFMAPQMVDKLENYQRETSGTPAEFGGAAGSGIRTGARGAQVMSSVVDFPVQEYQEIEEEADYELDKISIATEKAYWPNKSKSVFVGWEGAKGRIDYTPKSLWQTEEHSVSYSHAGADANGLAIAAGQRLGMETLSAKSFMEMDPMVKDPEYEHTQVSVERLTRAYVASFEQRAIGGLISDADFARVIELVKGGLDEYEAIQKVQREAQERQSPELNPVSPTSPEAQPGLAQPGIGAESASVNGPTPSMENLTQLLGSLRMPQMTVPSERGGS